jgi:hypothetical protein
VAHDDIRERAWDLVRSYGDDAGLHAAMKADGAMARGDLDAHRLWMAVMDCVERLDFDRSVAIH